MQTTPIIAYSRHILYAADSTQHADTQYNLIPNVQIRNNSNSKTSRRRHVQIRQKEKKHA